MIEAGRELDALVSEKVMGFQAHPKWANEGLLRDGNEAEHYSTSIAAAWEVVEKLHDTHRIEVWLQRTTPPTYLQKSWCCKVQRLWNSPSDYFAESTESASHAICLAALKAVGS